MSQTVPLWHRGFWDRIIRDDRELTAIRDYIRTNPMRWTEDQEYILCRVQWYGQGVIERGKAKGFDIKTKTQQVCKTGDFIVAEVDAKEGGFGIVPPTLDGAIVSSHYFLFAIDQTQLDPAFLGYYVRLPAFQE